MNPRKDSSFFPSSVGGLHGPSPVAYKPPPRPRSTPTGGRSQSLPRTRSRGAIIVLQMIMLEGAKARTETVEALRTGAAAMKAMQKATNINGVDKTMDEINEQTENMKQIQGAPSTPIGAAGDFDADELEAELEELEEQLLQPATTAPAAPIQYAPAGRQPTCPVPQKNTLKKMNLQHYKLKWLCSQV